MKRYHFRLNKLLNNVILITVLIFLVAGLINTGWLAKAAGSTEQELAVVLVEEGESLWQIAERIQPHQDPRRVIAEIREINRLSSVNLFPGQKLIVPGGEWE